MKPTDVRRRSTPLLVRPGAGPSVGRYSLTPQPAVTPAMGVHVSEYAKATALAAAKDQGSFRAAIVAFHGLLRDHNLPDLKDSIVVRLVDLYRQTDYLLDRLKTMPTGEELLRIELVTNHYCGLTELPPGLVEDPLGGLRFAHFQAGVFALARDNMKGALDHFSKAEEGWSGVKGPELAALLGEGKTAEAAEKLGAPFKRLRELLPKRPAVRHEVHDRATMAVPVLKDGAAASPPASPGTSTPQTRLGWRSRRTGPK